MHIAVVIPFRGDPATLQWTLDGLARQELPAGTTLDVRTAADGVACPPLPHDSAAIRFHSHSIPHAGAAAARNHLLQNTPADIVLFLNSDTRPAPACVAAHAARLMSLPENHMVLGTAPYAPPTPPAAQTVFDALKEHTPMVFFFNELQPHTFCDFRHAWTLNLSARYADLARINFFNPLLRPCYYEDIELGFRLLGPEKKAIYFDPTAQVTHRHPMTFDDYLNREELLGLMAPVLFHANRDLFRTLHGGADLETLAAQFRSWLALDAAAHRYIYQRMNEWNCLSDDALGTGPARGRLLMTLYQMHLPLKRLAFRLGFLRGLDLCSDAHWQKRSPAALWRQFTAPPRHTT